MFNDALWVAGILIRRIVVGRLEIGTQSLNKSIPFCGTVLTPSRHSPWHRYYPVTNSQPPGNVTTVLNRCGTKTATSLLKTFRFQCHRSRGTLHLPKLSCHLLRYIISLL